MSTRLGGRYQLVRELGAGGMGRVFQAVDTETGRSVAAKVMLATSDDNLDALLRFQQEGAVLSTLKHPNIVEVYGTFLEEHTSCIIMELLEGQSLSDMLRAGPLGLSRIKYLAEQTTSALAYAHGRAIVHRDIKPDNIMVVGNDHVKVTDFGIARIIRAGVTRNTATGMAIGTPLYMAPEQIEGKKVDGRADIYAFGALLFQMVTGQPPFDGTDPLTIAFKHVHKEPPKPRELAADVPDDWEALILKCLAKDPAERFQTAAALHEAITHLSTNGEEDAAGRTQRIVPPTQVVSPGPRRRDTVDEILNPELADRGRSWENLTVDPTMLNVPGAGNTVLGPARGDTLLGPTNGQGAAATRVSTTPEPAVASPVAPPRRKRVGLMAGGAVAAALLIGGGAYAMKGRSSNNGTPTRVAASTPLKVNVSGPKSGGAFASGKSVTLKWSGTTADLYRIRVAQNPQFKKAKTYITEIASIPIPVVGAATYYARVQGKSNGTYGTWSKPLSFQVARPIIGSTHFIVPKRGSSTTNRTIHLGWTGVKGAADYTLKLRGHNRTLHGTFADASLKPGNYTACVAPQVKGAQLYTGKSTCVSFSIKAKPKKKAQPVHHNPVQQPVQQQPVQQQPVQQQPVQQQPVQQQPVQQQPVQQPPASSGSGSSGSSGSGSNPCNPTC